MFTRKERDTIIIDFLSVCKDKDKVDISEVMDILADAFNNKDSDFDYQTEIRDRLGLIE